MRLAPRMYCTRLRVFSRSGQERPCLLMDSLTRFRPGAGGNRPGHWRASRPRLPASRCLPTAELVERAGNASRAVVRSRVSNTVLSEGDDSRNPIATPHGRFLTVTWLLSRPRLRGRVIIRIDIGGFNQPGRCRDVQRRIPAKRPSSSKSFMRATAKSRDLIAGSLFRRSDR